MTYVPLFLSLMAVDLLAAVSPGPNFVLVTRTAARNRVSGAWVNVEVGSICLQSKTPKTGLVLFGKPLLRINTFRKRMLPFFGLRVIMSHRSSLRKSAIRYVCLQTKLSPEYKNGRR